jgi:hypothetical protein
MSHNSADSAFYYPFLFRFPVYKRSVGSAEDKTTFMEFAGNKVSQMDLVNLENAPGSRK